MPLPEKFHKDILWRDWMSPKTGEPETIIGLAVIHFDKADGDMGYAMPVSLSASADDELKKAGKDFAVRKLIADFNLKLLEDSKPIKLVGLNNIGVQND